MSREGDPTKGGASSAVQSQLAENSGPAASAGQHQELAPPFALGAEGGKENPETALLGSIIRAGGALEGNVVDAIDNANLARGIGISPMDGVTASASLQGTGQTASFNNFDKGLGATAAVQGGGGGRGPG